MIITEPLRRGARRTLIEHKEGLTLGMIFDAFARHFAKVKVDEDRRREEVRELILEDPKMLEKVLIHLRAGGIVNARLVCQAWNEGFSGFTAGLCLRVGE